MVAVVHRAQLVVGQADHLEACFEMELTFLTRLEQALDLCRAEVSIQACTQAHFQEMGVGA